jgi:endonuclease YncB( thermonuclease family)
MPMLLVTGTFRVTHSEPDGDSVHFIANDDTVWDRVGGSHAVERHNGVVQLRLDAIDALETHYAPRGGPVEHQPLELAHAARDRVLELLGFTGVQHQGERVTAVDQDSLPGYVLTRTADKYGRCVALIGAGNPPDGGSSGDLVHVDEPALLQTVNYNVLLEGLVYPTYYSLLYVELRDALTQAAETARNGGRGLWADDLTQSGVDVQSLTTLTTDAVILPKLFRRLDEYLFHSQPDVDLGGFKAFLEQSKDRVWIVSSGKSTSFDSVVDVAGNVVSLNRPPEDLVFIEK